MDVAKFYTQVCIGKIKMSEKTLVKRVEGYLSRARNNTQKKEAIPCFPFNKHGYWKVMSGMYELKKGQSERVMSREIYKGRYIDAIAQAVQMRVFYGENKSQNDMKNPYHGYVTQASVINLKKLNA